MAEDAKSASELRTEAKELAEEIERLTEIVEPTDEEIAELRTKVEQTGPLADQIRAAEAKERAENLETIRSFARQPENVVPATPEFVSRAKRDPYNLQEMRFSLHSEDSMATELRERARDAIEQAPEYMSDEHRQAATVLVDRDQDGRVAEHILKHGSQEYTDAWFRYARTGEARAALSTTGANGGYLIPFHLDPTIILTNTGSKNPFRQISRVETITSNAWHGVSSAGVTAEWTSEAAEVTDASPTFSQPTITPLRADAYVQASFEVTQDSNIAAQIGQLFADAKDRLEAAAFATGNGSTQPYGIVTELQLVTASRVSAQTNASFGGVDVFALVNALPARYQDNCSWVAHWSIFNLVRQFGGANQPNFWVDLGPGIPGQLLGRNTYQSSSMQAAPLSAATASSDDILVLGDFSNYVIVDRIGMEVVYQPLVIGDNRRPTGEVGWAAFWRVGARTVNADAFRLLRV